MLKLAKLPDGTPARVTITVNVDLNQALCGYRKLYAATYGTSEKIADLILSCSKPFLIPIAPSPKPERKAYLKSMPKSRRVAPNHPARAMPNLDRRLIRPYHCQHRRADQCLDSRGLLRRSGPYKAYAGTSS